MLRISGDEDLTGALRARAIWFTRTVAASANRDRAARPSRAAGGGFSVVFVFFARSGTRSRSRQDRGLGWIGGSPPHRRARQRGEGGASARSLCVRARARARPHRPEPVGR